MSVITRADELLDEVNLKMHEVSELMKDVIELADRAEDSGTWGYELVNREYLRKLRKINRKIKKVLND